MSRARASKKLSETHKKRFEKLRIVTYDTVAANNQNKRDITRVKDYLVKVRDELAGLEKEFEGEEQSQELTREELEQSMKLHKKLSVKKKAKSNSFRSWLFNNNEI